MNPITRLNFKKLVATLIVNLSDEYKQLLSLYYVDELSIDEIAIVMNKPVKQIMTMYKDAVQKCVK